MIFYIKKIGSALNYVSPIDSMGWKTDANPSSAVTETPPRKSKDESDKIYSISLFLGPLNKVSFLLIQK